MADETPDSVNDDLAEEAADLILEADEQLQERRAEHEEFLDTVAAEEGAEVLETSVNLIGEYVVDVRVKIDGELTDRMAHMESRIKRATSGEGSMIDVSETADDVAQLLADMVDDPGWSKAKFYAAYEAEGLDPLGVMLQRIMESVEQERERRHGTAEGFRPTE